MMLANQGLISGRIQPYEKQAAADKERAEREKKIYEGGAPAKKPASKKAAAPYVRGLPTCMTLVRFSLTMSLSCRVPDDEDDDEDDE